MTVLLLKNGITLRQRKEFLDREECNPDADRWPDDV